MKDNKFINTILENKFVKKLLSNKIIKNFLLIFTGQGISSVFGLVSTLLMIAGIGSGGHGIIIMTQTYATLFFSLFSFKSFQGLIKYLAISKAEQNMEAQKLYIKWSFIFDVCSLLLMFVAGILLRDFMIGFMGWDIEIKKYVSIFLFVQLFDVQGTTIGVLRSFEKYDYVIKALIISSAVRCFGYAVSFFAFKTFEAFFIAEAFATWVNFALTDLYTVKVLKDTNLLDFYKVPLKFKKDFFMFNLYSNFASTLDLPVNQITQLIINRYLGFAANSAYNVFERLGTIINKLGDPINQIIYPEMNNYIVQKEIPKAKKLSLRLQLLMFGIFIVTGVGTLITYPLWFHLFIPDVHAYLYTFVLYLGFICFVNAAMGTHNLFMAMGYIKYTIPILVVINPLYLVLLYFLIQWLGLAGVILSYFIQAVAVVAVKEVILYRHHYENIV